MATISKQAKLLNTLRTGKELTAKEIQTKFAIANPYEAVRQLRHRHMVAVYGNKRTLKDGSVVTKYRIGTPTQAMMDQGYTA